MLPLVIALMLSQAKSLPMPQDTLHGRRSTVVSYVARQDEVPTITVKMSDGSSAQFVLDSGSPCTVVDKSLVDRLKLNTYPGGEDLNRLLGKSDSQLVQLVCAVKQIPIHTTAAVADLHAQLPMNNGRIDGILDISAFDGSALLVNPRKHEITIIDPGYLAGDDLKALGMNQASIALTATSRSTYTIPVSLNNGSPAQIEIDTGAENTGLASAASSKLHLPVLYKEPRYSLYGSYWAPIVLVHNLGFGQVTLQNIPLGINDPTLGERLAAHVGMDVLGRFEFLIDPAALKLYLKRLPD